MFIGQKFTADFSTFPLDLPKRKEPSSSSITPRGSPSSKPQNLPLVPQSTGEWFPSFRRSLLGGKSFNRFGSFVTSGAEEWVLQGAAEEPTQPPSHDRIRTEQEDDFQFRKHGAGEADVHFVDEGPSWKLKVPLFRILVHSPSKRTSPLTGAYTVYSVTSTFEQESEDTEGPFNATTQITVHRRFSHFVALHTALCRRLPGIALPPLPDKQYAGRFSDEFVEARRGDLERYLSRIVRHPVVRYAEVLTFFLSCENETVSE
jgi:sorting nexin-9/18/33